MTAESDELAKIKAQEGLSRKDVKRLEGKNKEELEEELTEIKKEKQTELIITMLS